MASIISRGARRGFSSGAAIAAHYNRPAPFHISHHSGFINGTWTSAKDTFAVNNPATGDRLALVSDMGPSHTLSAISAATNAQAAWAAEPVSSRSSLLMKLHALLLTHADSLATLLTLECGKPWDVRAPLL